jgi:hypothetical protein
MHALYWISAIWLLAAVLWGETSRPRPDAVITWDQFARQHGLDVDDHTPPGRRAEENPS